MSTYKVIQDIEAEDKLVGPLSLRQFLYALAAVVGGYLCFLSISKHAAILLVVFLPLTLGVAFFAVPWRKEQSTEVWALAHLRFFIMPRKRIWNQSGIREYVRIIAKMPKRKVYTGNGLSPDEVQSRLKALATTIDSRGWAVKGATPSDLSQIDPLLDPSMSDRLVGPTLMPKEKVLPLKIEDDIPAHEDILDKTNARAQNLSGMIDRQTTERHERLAKQVEAIAAAPAPATTMPQHPTSAYGTQIVTKNSPNGPATGQWFVNAPGTPGSAAGPTQITIIAPGTPQVSTAASISPEEEKALAAQFKAQQQGMQKAYYGHLKVLQPLGSQAQAAPMEQPAKVEAAPAVVHKAATPAPKPVLDKAVTAPKAHPAIIPAHPARAIPSPADRQAVADEAIHKIAAAKAASSKAKAAAAAQSTSQMTAQPDPAILELANNDDLSIATIARQINKHKSPNEVEIRLH